MIIGEITVLSFHVDFATREGVATCFIGDRDATKRSGDVGLRAIEARQEDGAV